MAHDNHKHDSERLAMADAVTLVKDWVRENRGKNRMALARYVCNALDLKDARGQLRSGGTLKALRVLEARGYWRLPKSQSANGNSGRGKPRRLGRPVAAPRKVPARVEQVQGLKLVEVSPQEDELFRTWNELIGTEHPLRDSRMVGRQLRYLIGSEQNGAYLSPFLDVLGGESAGLLDRRFGTPGNVSKSAC